MAVFFLSACQESENNTNKLGDSASKSGKVAIVLTDAPSDEFAEVNLTIEKITLMSHGKEKDKDKGKKDSESEDSNIVVFEGEETVNLLALENYSHLFALSSDVPVGTYHKIRLTLKSEGGIELVKRDDLGEITELHYPKLTGNAKLDLNAKKPFEVVADETLIIQLDIDAKKSINIIKTGNGKYKFRPVVFVDVITPEFSGKLVRHNGYVRNLDIDNQRFHLCANIEDETIDSALEDLCLLIHINDTSIFDENGASIAPETLENSQFATAIGYLRSHKSTSDSSDEFGQLLAQVLHIGAAEKFSSVDGEANTDVDELEHTFGLQIDETTEVSVLLQTETRVFFRNGTATNADQITEGRMLEAHGVYDDDDSPLLNATIIIIKTPLKGEELKLSGTVLEIFPEANSLSMTTDEGDRTIMFSDETVILAVDTSLETSFSEVSNLAEIATDYRIEVYGSIDDTGAFNAHIVLIVTD